MRHLLPLLTALMLAASAALAAEAPDGKAVMEMADQAPNGDNGRASALMTLTAADGSTRVREFTIQRKDYDAEKVSKYFIEFSQPADVKGTRFMVWDHVGQPDDRWMYLPRLRMVRRIAAEDDRGAFVGSDFTYEDISGRDPAKDTHTLLREEAMDGREAWVVESAPKEMAGVEFARKLSWVDKSSHLILQEHYFNAAGEKIKEAKAEKIESVQDIATLMAGTVKDLRAGTSTRIEFSNVQYNVDGLSDDQFTERALKQP